MERKERQMKIRYMLPAALGALLISAPVALAQQHGPDSRGTMSERGVGASIADFDLVNKGEVTIAKLQQPAIYRICAHRHGSSMTIIHDKNETKLEGGHCVDVEGSTISVRANEDGSAASGSYQVFHLGQHHD